MRAPDAFTVEVGHGAVRIRVSGPEAAPPVLLIHGIGRSLEDWLQAHDLLAGEFRVISADLPGFGFTPRLRRAPGVGTFAEAMVGVLDALGIERPVHVMGNSLGGAVAMRIAADHPERVASLVLLNAAGFGREVNLSPVPILLGFLSGLPVVGDRFRPHARQAGIAMQRSLFHDPAHVTEEMLRHAGRVGRQPDYLATFLAVARELAIPVYGVAPGWRRTLLRAIAARPEIPVLVVWGESDTLFPAVHLQAAGRDLPHARTHLFTETGHMPQIERAEEFSALAADFLTDVEAARA